MKPLCSPAALAGLVHLASALSTTIKLDYATFKGVQDVTTDTTSFLGMPFATAGRLENPKLITSSANLTGIQDATQYGLACPQTELVASPLEEGDSEVGALLGYVEALAFPNITRQGENCLNINVQVPKGIKDTANLPVLMWIHGGGFELGSSASLASETSAVPGVIYQGANLVQRSIDMKQPVVFVSANYRLNFFGTLASQEVTDAGVPNLCLKDQDVAFQWVQKYIAHFGGDPSKVAVFGQSAGAMSIATHMVLNNGNVTGKFQSAWLFSGPAPATRNYKAAQPIFDTLMNRIGCGTASDKLACVRAAPYDTIYAAIQSETNFFSYTSTDVPWYPRADGTYLVDNPAILTAEGKVADIPFVIGNMVDEGTLFSLVNQINVTTDADVVKYLSTLYFPAAPESLIEKFVGLYSDNPANGSPYGTGVANQIGPKYKKLASMIGDYTFVAGRRTLLNVTSSRQNTWSYQTVQSLALLGQISPLSPTLLTDIPVLGSFHVSDAVLNIFGLLPASVSKNTLNIMSSLVQFANTKNPNTKGLGLPKWPLYNPQAPREFQFREDGCRIISDTYRKTQMDFIEQNAAQLSV